MATETPVLHFPYSDNDHYMVAERLVAPIAAAA